MEKAKRNSWKPCLSVPNRQVLFVFLMAASFVSCDSNRIYEENFSVENNVWNKDDIKLFSFDIQDTLSPLDLFINLRTTTDYPYSNLYIFLYSEYPNGYTDKDTLEFILAEPDGKWLGESSGTIIENQILISTGGRFPNKGKYTFKIQHAMREPDLAEVIDIGFRVAFTEAK
jgi:gliding motility-associated lipoprotein GldH